MVKFKAISVSKSDLEYRERETRRRACVFADMQTLLSAVCQYILCLYLNYCI